MSKPVRTVIDYDLKFLVEDTIGIANWYDKKSRESGGSINFRRGMPVRSVAMTKEMEMLNEFTGASNPFEITRPGASMVSKWDRELENGRTISTMEFHMEDRRAFFGRWVYPCDCTCGNRVVLTAEELLERDSKGFGCAKQRCSGPPVDMKIWYVPRVALRLQLLQMRELAPHLLELFEGPFVSRRYLTKMLATEAVMDSIGKGNWWIKEVAEGEGIFHNNIAFTDTPDEAIFPEGQIHIHLGGRPVTINELCNAYEFDFDNVLEARMKYDDDTQLIDELLGEQHE